MNKNRITATVCYLAAVVMFICAAIWFYRSETGLGTAWFCFGIVLMISGGIWTRRGRNDKGK